MLSTIASADALSTATLLGSIKKIAAAANAAPKVISAKSCKIIINFAKDCNEFCPVKPLFRKLMLLGRKECSYTLGCFTAHFPISAHSIGFVAENAG